MYCNYVYVSTLVDPPAMVMRKPGVEKHLTKLLQKFLGLNLQLSVYRFSSCFLFFYCLGLSATLLIDIAILPLVFFRYSCNHLCFVCLPKARGWGKLSIDFPFTTFLIESYLLYLCKAFSSACQYALEWYNYQLLAVAGGPHDTLEEVIGIRDSHGLGSLKDFGVN